MVEQSLARIERSGPVATVFLSRPGRLDAISTPLVSDVLGCLDDLENDGGVRCAWLLPRTAGALIAKELMFLGDELPAERALGAGARQPARRQQRRCACRPRRRSRIASPVPSRRRWR